MSSELSARLAQVATGTAAAILRKLGVDRCVMAGIHAMTIETRIAGRARTVRFLPSRGDIKAPPRGRAHWELIETLEPGDVVVMDALGVPDGAVLGDLVATRVKFKGALAVVIDGVARDLDSLKALGLPVFSRAIHPGAGSDVLWAWEKDVPIQCGGVYVEPHDQIVADPDAVVVVPKALAERVAADGTEISLKEEFASQLLQSGVPLAEAYPLPASRQKEFEAFLRERGVATH